MSSGIGLGTDRRLHEQREPLERGEREIEAVESIDRGLTLPTAEHVGHARVWDQMPRDCTVPDVLPEKLSASTCCWPEGSWCISTNIARCETAGTSS